MIKNHIKSSSDFDLFYKELNFLIDLNNCKIAINFIKDNIKLFHDYDDLALLNLNCAFLNHRLCEFKKALDSYTEAIYYEDKIDILFGRSKDISYNGRSFSKYKSGDFKGAIEDKRKAKKIRLLEGNKFSDLNNKLEYRSIILGSVDIVKTDLKHISLIKASKLKKSKYDLIDDFKKVINYKRKQEIILKLEAISELKYKSGDFKGSIKALIRAEKYY